MTTTRRNALAALALLPASMSTLAASGDFDTTWGLGGTGKTVAAFDLGTTLRDNATASVLGADGSLYVVGNVAGADGKFRIGVAKFDRNGILDPTFDGDGRSVAALPHAMPTAAAFSPDGSRLYVAGYTADPTQPGRSDFVLCQFDPSTGSRPFFPTPLSSSCAKTNLGEMLGRAAAMAVQPDGKIVLAGTLGVSGSTFAMFARFLPNGQLDVESFASPSGFTTVRGDAYDAHVIRDVAIAGNGKIVGVGRTVLDGGQDDWGLVIRLDTDGGLDVGEYAFSRDESATRDTRLEAVVPVDDPDSDDDGLVIAGSVELTAGKTSGFLARTHPGASSLDADFGEFGDHTVVTLGTSSLHYDDIAALDDGGFVALGTRTSDSTVLDVSRFSALGVQDAAFGTSNAHTVVTFGTGNGTHAAGISVQGNSGIHVGAAGEQGGQNADFFAAKLQLDVLFSDGFED